MKTDQTTVIVVLEDGTHRTTSWTPGTEVLFSQVKDVFFDTTRGGQKAVAGIWIDGKAIARYTATEVAELAEDSPLAKRAQQILDRIAARQSHKKPR